MMAIAPLNLCDVNFGQLLPKGDPKVPLYEWFRDLVHESISFLPQNGLLRNNGSGFFAVTVKLVFGEGGLATLRNHPNPYAYFDFAYPDDDNKANTQQYADALRRVKATVRTGQATIQLRQDDFVDPIQDGDDTPEMLPWRELPRGGAVIIGNGEEDDDEKVWVVVGVDGFDEWENHHIAQFLAGMTLERFKLMCTEQDTETKPAVAEPQL